MICGWGKCVSRLERVLQKGPNVNFKGKDGFTPLHLAAGCASPTFTKRLLESNADPNVPATELNATPLDIVSDTIAFEEARDDRLNDFDQVNRLDDTALAIRPDLRPHREVRKILEEAGAVFGKDVASNGAVKGGEPSELRSYTSKEVTYNVPAHLKSGKYDLSRYQDAILLETDYDPKTGGSL